MLLRHDHRGFLLQITSIEEFMELVAIIRDDTVDDAKIKAMTDRLKASTKNLAEAQKQDKKG